jgi:hypothetical protein
VAEPGAYNATDSDLRDKVRLSDQMAAKLREIIGQKPKPFTRTVKALPRDYFVVGGTTYPFYGFLASDPQEGDAWHDPALTKFWEELNRVHDQLAPLKDFKP